MKVTELNVGGLSFTYGLETDDTVGASFVFNAHDASWITFARNLFVADQVMYRNRESAGCFNSVNYLAKAKAYQSVRPERVWVADAQRKYLRPYEDNGTETYLPMLAGKKTHQREQVKTYNSYYYASKYVSDFCTSQNIMVRGNTPTVWHGVAPANTATLSMYIDCYIVVASTSYNVVAKTRAKRGQTYVMDFSTIGSMGETELYFCTAPMITELSGLAHLYFKQNNFAMGTNLQRLEIGSNVAGYENPNLENLTIGNNKMLEYLDVRNCPNVSGALDLSGCISLRELYLENTNFTGISIAKGGLIETMHLDSPTSISMMELIYLTDLSLESADSLTTLRVENCEFESTATLTINGTGTTQATKDIVLNLIDSSNNMSRVRLVGVNWQLPNTDVLDRALGFAGIDDDSYDIQQSVLTGDVHVPTMKSGMLDIYNETWKYLTITYDAMVVQYLATFVNADGEPIKDKKGNNYTQWVDSGSTPYNPVTMDYEIEVSDNGSPAVLEYDPSLYTGKYYLDKLNGYIYKSNGTEWLREKECDVLAPSIEDTAQYDYEFEGWDDITTPMSSARTVVATYSAEIKKYTVTYYKTIGVPLEIHNDVPYGTAVSYGGGIPTWTDNEAQLIFRLFKGWHQSTGFVRGDMDVFAIWDTTTTLPPIGKQMNEMSLVEIYAVCQSDRQADYFEDLDYFDITLGHDYDFTNVESCEIGKDVLLDGIQRDKFVSGGYYFDGSHCTMSDIRLFEEDSPAFTMAIDFQFNHDTADTNVSMISNHIDNNTEGFRLYFNGVAPVIQWGDSYATVGNTRYRDIVVLRHPKGSNHLYVYSAGNTSTYFASSITKTVLLRSNPTVTSEPLTFGGGHYPSTSGFRDYCNGTLHWCKIWYDDIGEDCAYRLATWCREKARFEYWGAGKYYYYGTDKPCKASFVCNSILGGSMITRNYRHHTTATNVGGWHDSDLRSFYNGRIHDSMPIELQALIKKVEIRATAGNALTEIVISDDYIYVPSLREAGNGTTSAGYISEVGTSINPISWYTTARNRAKFRGKIRKYSSDSENTLYIEAQEPSALYDVTLKTGDLWVNTTSSSYLYYYVTQEEIDQYGYTVDFEADGGGWILGAWYSLRSPYLGNRTQFWYVGAAGSTSNSSGGASNAYRITPCFSF